MQIQPAPNQYLESEPCTLPKNVITIPFFIIISAEDKETVINPVSNTALSARVCLPKH